MKKQPIVSPPYDNLRPGDLVGSHGIVFVRYATKDACKRHRAVFRCTCGRVSQEIAVSRVATGRTVQCLGCAREKSGHDGSHKLKRKNHLGNRMRQRLLKAVDGNYRAGSAVRDLGCSINEFRRYIESLFQPGMTWKNHGKWHLDHIKPLASFDLTDREQFLQACHYTNYQPLWAPENMSKGAKLLA